MRGVKNHYLWWRRTWQISVVLISLWGLLRLFNLHIIISGQPITMYFPLIGSLVLAYLTIYYVHTKGINRHAEAIIVFIFFVILFFTTTFTIIVKDSGLPELEDKNSVLNVDYLYSINPSDYTFEPEYYLIPFYKKQSPGIYTKMGPYKMENDELVREALRNKYYTINETGTSIIFSSEDSFPLR